MIVPDFIFVTGCNAAGKSSLIRTRLNEFAAYEIIMTDVYKSRSQEVVRQAIADRKYILIETPFNEESFKDLIDQARLAGYSTSLIVLFLQNPDESLERVTTRNKFEDGLLISPGNVKYNFNENFKNVSKYFFYFDESFFIYTGEKGKSELIMEFNRMKLIAYKGNDFAFIQMFAEYAHQLGRLTSDDLEIIRKNASYHGGITRKSSSAKDWLTP